MKNKRNEITNALVLLKQYQLATKVYQGSISNNQVNIVKNLLTLPLKHIKKVAELRNMNPNYLDKQDLIIRLLRYQPSTKESKYLSLLNQNPTNEIDSKINEIKIMLIEYVDKITNKEISKLQKNFMILRK